MTAMHIPVDSTDAREQRELEQALAEAAAEAERRHADVCQGGWLAEDAEGRPVPCRVCRPHLVDQACTTCQLPAASCVAQRARRWQPCCSACVHPSFGRMP